MAFQTPPGNRMMYQRDGSILMIYGVTQSVIRTLTTAEAGNVNGFGYRSYYRPTTTGDSGGSEVNVPSGQQFVMSLLFPQAREIDGYYLVVGSVTGNISVETSADTTDGVNGTWAGQESVTGASQGVSTDGNTLGVQALYRTAHVLAVSGVKAIRWRWTSAGSAYIRYMHCYGEILAATASTRLQMWHPTLDQALQQSDVTFGDMPRETTETYTFRVKNMSATATANSVTLAEAASGSSAGSPSILSFFQVSADGTNWGDTASIGNLAPGAISSVCHARMNLAGDTAPAGPYDPFVYAYPTSWTT